ncbi:ABC transporter substrate-binding protein [Sabulicella glaciei]|uniref:ABC transporter substrate-binding protein n=1 Tax=Sabulicella glaciei TaxID=2984948 RepID=A0ABT3NWK7_9PROT|nr:ABC transporter substrate-binding protein [Roseococcus sp. MDT2-1-1]MCW8086273.1 ABC transporter substrate-binding protein [Roseococcus sp. MDT2-1-1]
MSHVNTTRRGMMAFGAAALAAPALAQSRQPLRISVWGGSWRDLVSEQIGRRFTQATGIPVEYQTGGTIDRLNRARLTRSAPESDITFTTSHIGWLYANDDLYERFDAAKVPNASRLVEQARISPFHVGTWAYVYTIGWRPDLLPNMNFESWEDLWKPELRNRLAAPDFDPSHLIAVAAKLEGADAANWERGQDRLRALRPNFRAFYTNDANSQQLIASGDTPVQVILSMNAHHIAGQGVNLRLAIPREGAVLGVDTAAVMKGSRNQEAAWRFIDMALDPAVQAGIAADKKGSPTVTGVQLPQNVASLPGVFTTPEQWSSQALIIDHRLRAEKTNEWRRWFQENIIAR